MRLFGIGRKRPSHARRQPKPLKKILEESFAREVNKDPDLKRELAFKEAGHPEMLNRDKDTNDKKKQIKKFITDRALEEIQGNPEMAAQFIESEVENILTDGKPNRYRGRENYFSEGGGESGLDLALGQLDSLNELKDKLADMGLGEGGKGGFWSGMTMKDLMGALPIIASLLGKGQPMTSEVQRTFVVRVNGQDKEVTENEYRRLLQEGNVTPVTTLAPVTVTKPTAAQGEEATKVPVEEEKFEAVTLDQLDLSKFIGDLDPSMVEVYMGMEPSEFVDALKGEVDAGIDRSKFLWGFFGATDYLGVVNVAEPHKDSETWGEIIKKVMSEEGKLWIEQVLDLVKEYKEEA